MSKHVHVRLTQATGVNEDGELVETSHCRCGATWTRTYEAREGDPEQ
jgi:hypothetical protein